jgi:pseudomonalisin
MYVIWPSRPRRRTASRPVRRALLAVAAALSTSIAIAAPGLTAASARISLAVPGSAPVQVRGARLAGPTTGMVSAGLELRTTHQAELSRLLSDLYRPESPRYHAFLRTGEFARRFAPDQASVSQLDSYLHASGVSTRLSQDRLYLYLEGTPAAMGKAFGVRFGTYTGPDGRRYRSTDRSLSLPPALAPTVAAAVGFSDLGRFQLQTQLRPAVRKSGAAGPATPPQTYGPQDFWSIYDVPASPSGRGQKIGILAEGDVRPALKDLPIFEAKFGLPRVATEIRTVGAPSADLAGSGEWDLDTQYSTAYAPNVSRLIIYAAASLGTNDIADEMHAFAAQNAVHQASFSAGLCEPLAVAAGMLTAGDQALQEAVAQGQTLFVASGDAGSFCPALVAANGVPLGAPAVEYPASSAFAIGTGGTTLLANTDHSYNNEIAWYAGGGGVSTQEDAPSFQTGAGGSFAGVKRGVPDVSLDSDPNTGYAMVVGGADVTAGGTSAAAPSWLGIWARCQEAHHTSLGFAGPKLYAAPAAAFHDVVVGYQGIFAATPGWDYTTGRGTPDVAALIAGVG